MDGRDFIAVARELARQTTEAHWRTAIGRAYYALLLTCRLSLQQWGFARPPRFQVHAIVRLRLVYSADVDLQKIGHALENLGDLRNRVDYEVAPAPFAVIASQARDAVALAVASLALLDTINADAPRRTAIIAGIRAAFP